jgi:hypothetical protein
VYYHVTCLRGIKVINTRRYKCRVRDSYQASPPSVSVILTLLANHVSLGLMCLQIWGLQRAEFQSVSHTIYDDDLCIITHYSLAFPIEQYSNGWLLNLWNNLNICCLWDTGYGYVIMCFYLNVLYIKACTTIKILIKRSETVMHLNYICCLLHKYSFFSSRWVTLCWKTYMQSLSKNAWRRRFVF